MGFLVICGWMGHSKSGIVTAFDHHMVRDLGEVVMAQIESSSFGTFSKEKADIIAKHLEELARVIRDDPSKIIEFDWSMPEGDGMATTSLIYRK
ncbi:TPA: hypothetical protein ACX3LN_000606 [Enterobacter hormaechei]|uniref:Uncharacterized protein n=2 Tax=Enterobacter TaxID=547 RepID=A0ABY0AX15_9ENTR|nr:hypothetical protein [Enterobacter quasimori]ELJ9614592.1 hypothetical protein [Enterobacter hormaechei]RTN26277.1 hypothetical protein EKN94_04215 [Enterobacter quasimori]HDR2513820.1 hypothetical protein [Enterobacter ludwigii]HEB4090225.1 hypothetical protein [Enterobacter cloacae]